MLRPRFISYIHLSAFALFDPASPRSLNKTSLLGCCGSLTQNRCMLLLYFALVTIIFLVEIVLAITIYVKKDSVETVFTDEFKDCMSKYYNETAPLHSECIDVVNTFQSSLKCCGATDPSDWEAYSNYSTSPPASCCPTDKQDSCDYGITFKEGCIGVIENFVNSNTQYIGFGVLAIAVIQLLGMLFACYLRTLILKRTVYEEPHSL
eukprot:sb/3470379/